MSESTKLLRITVSGNALESSVTAPMTMSVQIHRRHGKSWDLIQDVANITGNIYETFFVHHDEVVFLKETKINHMKNIHLVEKEILVLYCLFSTANNLFMHT